VLYSKGSSDIGWAWFAGEADSNPWLQINLDQQEEISGVVTQCAFKGFSECVTEFAVATSADNITWVEHGSGLALQSGQYVRIDNIVDADAVINLIQIQAFDSSGALLIPTSAELSGTLNSYHASNCIDGNPTAEVTMCHSAWVRDQWF
jgi:hypothetical protein